MLIDLINKGSVPYGGSNDNNSTGVSLSEILLCLSFMLAKYIACNAYGLRSSYLSVEACYILHLLEPLPCKN